MRWRLGCIVMLDDNPIKEPPRFVGRIVMVKRMALIVVISLLLRLIILDAAPFYRDEALYAEIIDEMVGGSGPIPHYAGVPAPWKPPLTFWFYSVFVWTFKPLNLLQLEILYRLPGIFLGVLCSLLVYLIARKLESEDLAFVSALAYSGTALSVFVNRMVLTDSLLSLFILGSAFCYLKASQGHKWVLLGGLLAGFAVFTKTFAGLYAPALAIGYYFLYDRKFLKRRDFLGSLLFIPFAFVLLLLFVPGSAPQFAVDSMQRTAGYNLGHALGENTLVFLGLSMPWLALALYGAYKYRRELACESFWIFWLILGLVPLFSNGPLFWYFLPLIPAISVLSGKVVLAGGKADGPAIVFMLLLAMLSLGALYVIHTVFVSGEKLESQRSLGLYLSGKGSLLVSDYAPTVLYYAFRGKGHYNSLDALFVSDSGELSPRETQELIANSALPRGSLNFSEAILYPDVKNRIRLGEFNTPREFIALSRELYEEYEPGSALAGFEKSYEDENFIVLRRK